MVIVKSVALLAVIGTAFSAIPQPRDEVVGVPVAEQEMMPGWVDIHLEAEEAAVGHIAGFFDVTVRTVQTEDGAVVHTESDNGTIALTFEEFNDQPIPADHPTNFDGMFVLGRGKYPLRINLTARPRKQQNTFNVTLTGFTQSECIGIATVEPQAITMRLQNDKPHLIFVTLSRQPSGNVSLAKDDPMGDLLQGVPPKPYVPDGQSAY